MDNEDGGPASGGVPEPAPATGGLDSAERLVMIGALLLIGDFVIFEFALDEYFFFWGVPLVAGFALTAIWLRTSRPGTRWPVPYWWLLQVLGGAAGIIGLVSLLSDLRRGVLDNGADLIGGLLLYAGAGLMLWGSRQVEPS